MGGLLSEEAPLSAFPTTGKAMILRVQCSHTSQVLEISSCGPSRITSDWTFADLAKAIEQATGVHRKCQTLMFGGKEMMPRQTLQSVIGAKLSELPTRVTTFMLVDRDVFPQQLGPFHMVRAAFEESEYQVPDLDDEDFRAGFSWEMRAHALQSLGVRARSSRIRGQVSPLHPVHQDLPWHQAVCAPHDAVDFAWTYPAYNWEKVESEAFAADSWEGLMQNDASGAMKSLLTVGGFLFFDGQGTIVGASTPGRSECEEASALRFRSAQRWKVEWTHSLAEQGRFQRVTIREFVDTGAKMFCWLRPNEVIEDHLGSPLPEQPQIPYGGFVYLFREDLESARPKEVALDRYFPVAFGKGAELEPGLPGSRLEDCSPFRAFSLVEPPAQLDDGCSSYGTDLEPFEEGEEEDEEDFDVADEHAEEVDERRPVPGYSGTSASPLRTSVPSPSMAVPERMAASPPRR